MSESRTGSPGLGNFDETLPCFENTSLPQDVFDLQNEYARINQEAENSTTKETTDDRHRSNRTQSERRNSKSRNRPSEQSGTSRVVKEGPEELAFSSEHEDVFRTDESLSTPCRSKLIQHKLPSTGLSRKETAEGKHSVKYKRNILSSSLPSNLLTSEFRKDSRNNKTVKRKPRRTSEPTQEVAKLTELEVGEDDGVAKVRARPVRVKISVSANTKNTSSQEMSEDKYRSLHLTSPGSEEMAKIKNSQNENESVAVRKVESTLTERCVSPTRVLELEKGECNKRINKKERAKTNPMSVSLTSTSFATGSETMTDQELRTNSTASSKTIPIKLPSHLSSEEHRKEAAASNENAIVVASESYDSACSKCQKHDKYTPSSSYCLNCAHYLCDRCLRHHNRIKSNTSHHIMQGKRMPGSFSVKQYEKERSNSGKCSHHPNRNIKCFCIEHCILCCTECKSSDHAKCEMQPLEHLLIQTPDVWKLKHQTSEISKLKLTSLLKLCATLKLNKETLTKENSSIIQEVKNKSSLMTEHIKKLEKDFIEYVSKRFDEAQSELDKDIEECENNIKVISRDIQYLDEPKASKESKIKTIERVKQIEMKEMPERMQNHLKDEAGKDKTHEFNVDMELFRKITDATSLGELVIICSGQSQLNNTNETENSSCIEEDEQLNEPVPKCVHEFHSISGWTEGDFKAKTCLTAIELLQDGTVLVSDLKNMKIKWFDSEFSLIKSLNVSSEPWGISRTYTNKYLVTLPMETSYQEIEFGNGNMNLGRKVNIGIECTCAVQTENQLLFAGIDGDQPTFLLTGIDGATKEQILTDQTLQRFKRPNHLLKSVFDQKVIFVSDVDTGVFAVDIDQKAVLFNYTNKSLKCPMGMAMTNSGHLYICSQQTQSLHCISKEGLFLYSVPLNSIVDMRTPQCICHLPHLDEFLLTTDNSYSFVRFKLN